MGEPLGPPGKWGLHLRSLTWRQPRKVPERLGWSLNHFNKQTFRNDLVSEYFSHGWPWVGRPYQSLPIQHFPIFILHFTFPSFVLFCCGFSCHFSLDIFTSFCSSLISFEIFWMLYVAYPVPY